MMENTVSPKFIVDNNVGKLVSWLRALGYDTAFINPIADSDLVRIAREEDRIILTADNGVMERKVVKSGEVQALFVELKDWKEQLRSVAERYPLNRDNEFTRCLVCNGELTTCDPSVAKQYVPPSVAATQDEYRYCANCDKYYWKGSHWQRMDRMITAILMI
jgi:uncharacterized protein with PIN domain